MNIKQAEALSGVSRQNIRFYEREGLLSPKRNPENDYREYEDGDIRALKKIRALRTLDMPLEQVKAVLNGTVSLQDAAADQQKRLETEMERLSSAAEFCRELTRVGEAPQWNVDEMLLRMQSPEAHAGLSQSWKTDYYAMVRAEHKRVFTFVPEEGITNPREFTAALYAFAKENQQELVITKESMYPEFSLDGIEYTAARHYTTASRVPVAVVRCTAVHPEEFEPDLPAGRKRLMKLLNLSWLLIPLILMNLDRILHTDWGEMLATWQGWVLLLSMLILLAMGIFRFILFHFNDRQK